MGKYSELIGSFKRMGSFPMEANFIFENETALKDFYSSPEEAATLHKGLLKLVADSATGEQSLWWVTKKQTNDELEFTKLIDSTSVESLEELAEKLEKEIYDRQVADDAIYGSSDHTVVPEDLNSLLKIAEAIAELREAIEDDSKVDTIKEELKATVGTELDDIREYLKTLDYQSLTAVSEELHRFLTTREPNTDSIDTFPELLDFLAGFKDTDVLQDVLDALVADIMGDPLPTEPFRTLRGIEDFVREFKAQSENTDANLQTELDQTQVGVGLSGDGAYNPDKETYYLKDATSVMNALKILDSLINEAINNCNLEVEDTNTVDLTINKQTTKTVLSADVKISTNDGNGIQAKNDGLFYKLETEYENGILTVKVNDNIISRHTIGLSTIVESAKYDPDQEAIIMVFKLLDGSKQELVIPVGTLIREWEVDNSHPTKVVVLEKEDVLGGGTDKLSADVRLYVDKYQILEKRDNTLYVKGTTDNLTHNDEALDVVIDRIISSGSDTNDALQAEIDRAKAAEQALDNKITAETTRADKVETQLRNDLNAEIKRATGVETDLQKQIDNLQDSTSTDISELEAALKAEVERSTEKDAAHDAAISEEVARATEAENQLRRDLTTTNEKVTTNTTNIEKNADAIAKETERATAAESSLSDGLRAEIERATTKETELEGAITTHINDTNNPHNVTKEQVGLGKVDNTTDLEKPISVATQAALDTKADKTYVDAQLDTKAPIDSPVFKGNPQVENPPAPNDSSNRIPSTAWVNETIKNSVSDGLEAHVSDFNNPHHVTKEQVGLGKVDNTSDLEKPISIAVQEALNNIKTDATGYATKEELTNHINDRNNPHNVTKEQIGLGNVDNTSDMNKPISTATQMALDKKADIHHSHTMTDITDLENLPIIKGFVTVLSELPESATGGDRYIMSTQVGSGSTRYTLLEFDGATGTWKQKLLTTGGIATVIDGDVWELTGKGIKRVLDADDYKYFYDKVWGETKDLVQSIEWDETVSDKIRLKVTTKKSYADPNTDEATKPTVTPKVTYIDIEKERFMSSAYSRPATQEDVNNGYASKVGVPVLVIELTTGDEIVIDLTDTMNIYDPVDTSSIDMEVSNWTGTAATSYKISATLKIAENSDAVKLVDNGTSGVYARLDKKNTNSIQMVDDGSLSANLVIDTAKNNLSDILLTIGAAGLSAQFIIGEYD